MGLDDERPPGLLPPEMTLIGYGSRLFLYRMRGKVCYLSGAFLQKASTISLKKDEVMMDDEARVWENAAT